MDGRTTTTDHITLTQAAKLAPGRPSTNCLWRWCRRGVLTRTGERIRLRHVRAGGKIYTAAAWVDEFCHKLADTDATYFDAKAEAAKSLPPRDPRFAPPSRSRSSRPPQAPGRDGERLTEIEDELEEEGL